MKQIRYEEAGARLYGTQKSSFEDYIKQLEENEEYQIWWHPYMGPQGAVEVCLPPKPGGIEVTKIFYTYYPSVYRFGITRWSPP